MSKQFMKWFLFFTWCEPFVFEIFFGIVFFLFPNNSIILNSFVNQQLLKAIINSKDISISSTFLIRFIGMLTTTFGALHYLLLCACDQLRRNHPTQNKWTQCSLFKTTVVTLLIGDFLHISCILLMEGALFSPIALQIPMTAICIIFRTGFLLMTKAKLIQE